MYIIELFAGAGVAHRGFPKHAFIDSYEIDRRACESAALFAIRHHRVDLSKRSGREEVIRRAMYQEPADLLWASPPCQGFSSAGSRLGPADPRNGFPWVQDLLESLIIHQVKPRRVMLENVRGLTFHKKRANCGRGRQPNPDVCEGCYLEAVKRDLAKLYDHVESRVLNCADYGTPQRRQRLIIQASDEPIVWPQATHYDPSANPQPIVQTLLPWVTMRQALPHLTEEARIYGAGTNPHGKNAEHERRYRDITDEPAPTIAAQHGGGAGNAGPFVTDCAYHRGLTRAPDLHLDQPAPTLGTKGNQMVVFGLLDKPAPTVSASEVKGAGARASSIARNGRQYRPDGGIVNRASCALMLETGRRRLTVEECALLQGLDCDPTHPDQAKKYRYRQVGNGVPPQLVRALVRAYPWSRD